MTSPADLDFEEILLDSELAELTAELSELQVEREEIAEGKRPRFATAEDEHLSRILERLHDRSALDPSEITFLEEEAASMRAEGATGRDLCEEARSRNVERYAEVCIRIARHGCVLNDVEDLLADELGPATQLREVGTPEELREALRAISAARDVLHLLERSGVLSRRVYREWLEGNARDEVGEIERRLVQLGRLVDAALGEAEEARTELKAAGLRLGGGASRWEEDTVDPRWRWSSRADRFGTDLAVTEELTTTHRHRRRGLLARAVARLGERYDLRRNDLETRQRLAVALRPWFELSTEPRSDLANALNSYLRRFP